jgi:hypothetical protein
MVVRVVDSAEEINRIEVGSRKAFFRTPQVVICRALSRVPISDSKGLSSAPSSPFPRRYLSTSLRIHLCQIGHASGCQLVCCRVVRSPVTPSTNSFTRSPSPPNTAFVSARSIAVRSRVHIRLACSKEYPSNLEIRGRGSAEEWSAVPRARRALPVLGAQHRPRGAPSQSPVADQEKPFLSNNNKKIGIFRVDRAAHSLPFIAVTTRGSAPASRWCVRL